MGVVLHGQDDPVPVEDACCLRGLPFQLDAQRARQLGIATELLRFAEHLENLQLAGKSEVQRAFLKAQREQREMVD